jgi:hypothetical protein
MTGVQAFWDTPARRASSPIRICHLAPERKPAPRVKVKRRLSSGKRRMTTGRIDTVEVPYNPVPA